MQLMMYIGNDHIESIKLDPDRISKPGYLGTFKRNLKAKYKDLISQHGSPADFIVINIIGNTNKTSVAETENKEINPRYQQS